MIRVLALICIFCFGVAQGGIESHFKKAENKTNFSHMRGIDYIYTINLDQRPEKFEHCKSSLAKYGIYPYRFSAVNGWELSLQTLDDIGVKYGTHIPKPWAMMNGQPVLSTTYLAENANKPRNEQAQHEEMHVLERTYFCHCMPKGSIGIVLSHLSILQDAYDSGYETIWVMEDDIEVVQNPHKISDLIVVLDILVGKNGWDILFTDRDTKSQKGEYVPCKSYAPRPGFTPQDPKRCLLDKEIGKDFRQVGARYGAYSMIVRRSAMEKILNYYKKYKVYLPYDMEFTLVPDIKFFTVLNDVVSTQPQALSDNGAPGYQNKKK